jgi:hypothetical protein
MDKLKKMKLNKSLIIPKTATLRKLNLIKAIIRPESVKKGTPVYEIEEEFQKWVILHADFILSRYEANPLNHFKTQDERENVRLGLRGQKAFELLLQLLEVPYVPNDPVVDQRLQKSYDFLIPALGKIEVKTEKHYARKVLVKVSEWHHDDYLVAWQMHKDGAHLTLIGWLTRKQVEAHPKTPKGATKYNPYTDSYIIDISELNPPDTFIKILNQHAACS